MQAVKGVQGFNVLNGPDSLIHQGFVDGCSACISGLANVAPEPISQIWHRFNAGDIEGSRQAQEQVAELRKTLYAIAFSPAVVKKALAIMGEDVGVSRYPIQFSAQDEDNIRNILSQFSQ